MSWTSCKRCGEMIDSDKTPECYYLELDDDHDVPLDYALCENCKEIEIEKIKQFSRV